MNPDTQRPPEGREPGPPLDDATIGRAFRWTLVAVIAVLLIGAVILMLRNETGEQAHMGASDPGGAAPAGKKTSDKIEPPAARFNEITEAAGIHFVHNNGAVGEKYLPETMGGGVGFFDYDNDADQDLLFVNGIHWPGSVPPGAQPATAALYQNDGRGNFKDVTAGSGLDLPIYGMAPAFGDFDNDGFVDLFITAVGRNRLFKNLGGGKFEDRTDTASLGGAADEWSSCAAWVDIDHDGDLDLFVGNYVKWSPQIDQQAGLQVPGVGRLYGQPRDFQGTFPYLYRNEGGGRFTDISAAAGVQVRNQAGLPAAKALGVAPLDVDQDGWIDLVVANDTVQNFLFHNQKDGTFKEIGARTGVAFDTFGGTRGAMGIDSARYGDNGALGIVIGNFVNEMSALYKLQPGGGILFSDEALAEGIGVPTSPLLTFGTFFFDYDLDGRQDILSVNGHLDEQISKVQKAQQYRQPAQLFWNSGEEKSGRFVAALSEQAGADLFQPIAGRGSAYADIDADGDLDVVLTQTGGKPLLLRNDQALNHNWIRLKLTGTKSNHDAIGAWVHARVAGKDLWRQVMPTRSYLSQSELPVTLGLGTNTTVELLEVKWPNGSVQKVEPHFGHVTTVIQY